MLPRLILLALLCYSSSCYCQQARDNTAITNITGLPYRFFDKITKKTASIEDKLTEQTEKYLRRRARCEQKLKRKLYKIDSSAAKDLFKDLDQQYAGLMNKMPGGKETAPYLPFVDTLKTSLSFLQQNDQSLPVDKDVRLKIQTSLANISSVERKLQQSDRVKAFAQLRQQQIKQALRRYTNLPHSITDTYKDFNKDLFYYSQQAKEYRELLNNPDRLTQNVLALLSRVDGFQQFLKEHSQLAGLFSMPANYGQGLAGLQMRVQVQQLIANRFSSTGPDAQQMLHQHLQAAQTQLDQLKERINKPGSSDDIDMPDFTPNNQRTKSFWKRLEYGTNIQTARSGYFFPATTDLGLSVGYKLSGKSVIGIGASYKTGWGKDIRHIAITNKGMGIRSFVDIKLKGSFYASGGYEYNYQPVSGQPTASSGGRAVELFGGWKESGLIGISKIVSFKNRLFKKTKLQLLWDFMSYQQVPRTQAVKYRIGYNF